MSNFFIFFTPICILFVFLLTISFIKFFIYVQLLLSFLYIILDIPSPFLDHIPQIRYHNYSYHNQKEVVMDNFNNRN